MNVNGAVGSGRIKCRECPLHKLDCFRRFDGTELDFVSAFKSGELSADPGATIFAEGAHSAHMYTLLAGVAFRYKMLEDGRRQVLNYLFPGDLAGLQGTLTGEMQHSVEALTPVALCMFERARVHDIYQKQPALAFDITWIAAREERMLDEHLLSVGRRSALERSAYLLAFLAHRAISTGYAESEKVSMPITQQLVADTLGLSIVHTNKTLRKLADRGLVRWLERGCRIEDYRALAALAGWEPDISAKRPFI